MKNSTIVLLLVFLGVLWFYFTGFNKQNSTSHNAADTNIAVPNNAVEGTDFIATDNYANKKLQYYYYIPETVAKKPNRKAPFLIMVPGLSGDGQSFVTQQFKDFAKQEGVVIIAPTFIEDSENWNSQTSYQYPAAWSGLALNKIIIAFDNQQHISSDGVYLFGFSAGAQFVSRYSLLYPNYVTACVFNAAGGTDNPVRYQATKFYVAVGAQDEDVRKDTAQDFYNSAKQQGIDVTFKEYNIGHALSDEEIKDEINFLAAAKRNR